MTERTRHRLAAAGLALLLIVAPLALIEWGLRIAGRGPPPMPSPFPDDPALGADGSGALPDVELFYRLRPDARFLGYYRINSLGARGPDVLPARRPGTLRVVCTGDSSTFGLGVPEDRAWPFVLKRLLDAAVGDLVEVEVIDSGVPGYTSTQNRVQVERDLLALQPDVVVWMPMGHNDNVRVEGRDDGEALEYRRSLAFRLSRLALPRALGLNADVATPADADSRGPAGADQEHMRPRVPLPAFEQNLRAVAIACANAEVPLLLVVPPHGEVLRERAPEEAATEGIVLRVADELHVPIADPRASLAALGARPLFPDTVHPSPDAHAVIAWHVFESLAAPGMLPWPAGRDGFARAWIGAHRDGLASPGRLQALLDPTAPPDWRELLAAMRGAAPDEHDVPPELLQLDPLDGSRRSPYDLGRLLLADAADSTAELEARVAALREHVTPTDDLALLLFASGVDASRQGPAPAPDALLVARALAARDAFLGAHAQLHDDRLDEARRLALAGDTPGALALVEQVLALNPGCAEAYEVRGFALERSGNRKSALEAYAIGSQLEPDSTTGLFLLGRTTLQRGDPETAVTCLERALQLDPAHKLARLALIHARLRQNLPDEAEQQLRTLQRVGVGDVADVPALEAAIAEKRAALAGAR